MAAIYWLIPLTIIILVIAAFIFFWAVKDGQYDDLDSPAVSILLDDDRPASSMATADRQAKLKSTE